MLVAGDVVLAPGDRRVVAVCEVVELSQKNCPFLLLKFLTTRTLRWTRTIMSVPLSPQKTRKQTKCPISKTLAGMDCGERAWFIYLQNATPRLLIQPLKEDARQTKINRLRRQYFGDVAPDASGVLQRQSDGSFVLVGYDLPTQILEDIYKWLNAPGSIAPRCLNALSARSIDQSGTIHTLPSPSSRADDYVPVNVGLLRASKRVQALGENESARVWAVAAGAGSRPMLVVREVRNDPQGADFKQAIAQAWGCMNKPRGSLTGMIHRRGEELFFFTETPLPKAISILRVIVSVPEAASLAAVKVAFVSEGGVKDIDAVSPELDELVETVQNIRENYHAYFILKRKGCRVHLKIAATKQELKCASDDAEICKGRIMNNSGELRPVTRRAFPGATTLFRRWLRGRSDYHPIIRKLSESNLIIENDIETNISSRYITFTENSP